MGANTGYDDILTPEEIEAMKLDEKSDEPIPTDDDEVVEDETGTDEQDDASDEEAHDDEQEDTDDDDTDGDDTQADDELDDEQEDTDDDDTAEDEGSADDSEDEVSDDSETDEGDGEDDGGSDSSVADEVAKAALFEVTTPDVVVAMPTVEEVEANTERLTEIDTRLKELADKLSDGDIELSDYMAEQNELMAEKIELKTQAALLRQQAEQGAKQIQAQWEADAKAFLAANPVFSPDNNPALFGALDANIKEIASSDEAANMSNREILREAAMRVHKQLQGLMPTTDKTGKEESKPKKQPKAEARKKQVKKATKQAANIRDAQPAASNDSSGEFAYLDKLEGAALEEAIAKLPADKLERYLAL